MKRVGWMMAVLVLLSGLMPLRTQAVELQTAGS